MQQVFGAGVRNNLVDHGERIAEVRQHLGLGPGGIRTTEVAPCRRLFAGDLLRPRLVGASHVLHLLAKGAYILEFSLHRFEPPLVFRHGLRQRGKVLLNVLPDEVDRVWNGLGLGRALLCHCRH